MKEKSLVRIVESELKNFKNVKYGNVKYVNYSNVENRAELMASDVNGIYGQNGSGKTAIIEALEQRQYVADRKSRTNLLVCVHPQQCTKFSIPGPAHKS